MKTISAQTSRVFISCILRVCMTAFAFSAFGEATVYEDPIVLDAQTNIVVASGDTLTLTGLISGEGSIKKTGDGTLILAHEGGTTFSGGIALNGGRITANTSGAFGTGNVTGTGSAITFNAADGVFANNFSLGTTSVTPPTFAANTTIDGTVTIKREHNFFQNDTAATVVFNGAVNGNKNIIYQSTMTTRFKGPLGLSNLYAGSKYSHTGTLELWNPTNAFSGQICLVNMKVVCYNTNVMNGASISLRLANSTTASINLNGHDQTVKSCTYVPSNSFTVPSVSDSGRSITTAAAAPATLKITGTGANKNSISFFAATGAVTLELDADPTFRQVFTNRASTTTGALNIRSGIFEIAGPASFKNVGRATVSTNGQLLVTTTASAALSGVTNFVLSGTFSSTFQPFTDGAVDLVVSGENASLTLPADARLNVKSLTVDGVPLSGELFIGGDESCPWLKSGEIVVLSHESADTWTGAGSTSSITEADNWKSGAKPDLAGFCTATFADANAVCVTATVDRAVAFAGLRLDSTNGFAFAADVAGSVLSVSTGGIVAAESPAGAAPVYDFAAPVRLIGEQTWIAPAGTTLRLLGGTTSAYAFEKTGDGSITISGTNTWDKRVILRGGVMTLSGTITTSSGVDTTRLDGDGDSPDAGNAVYSYFGGSSGGIAQNMYLKNVAVEKAFWVDMASASSEFYFRSAAAATNTFRAFFRSRNKANQKLYVPEGSEVRFEGGAKFPWAFVQGGKGTVRFSKTPVIYTATSETGYSIQGCGNAVFDVGTNTLRYLSIQQDGGRFDFTADHVCGLGDYCTIRLYGGLRRATGRAPCGSVVDIHGTRQRVGMVLAYDKYFSDTGYVGLSKIAGDAGSVFEITNNVTTRSSAFDHVPFVGGVSLVFGSPGTITFTNVTHTSTGTVEVARGTMRFRSGATWLTATKVKVGGTLVLTGDARNGQTFGRKADWYFGENGVVSIPNGVVQHAGHVWIGDTELPPGRYSYAETADESIRSHFDPETTGVLRVHGSGEGSVIIIF